MLLERQLSPRFTAEVQFQGSGLLDLGPEDYIQWNTESGNTDETATYRLTACAETATGACAQALQTGAVTLDPGARPIPLGSTIYLENWNLQINAIDTGGAVGLYQVDVYAGIGNTALAEARRIATDYSRVWVLEQD